MFCHHTFHSRLIFISLELCLCVCSQISEELQEGVQPFKEESLRLIKENSHLRLAIQRNQETLDEQLRGEDLLCFV
jgi:hypothetical protein